MIRLRYRNDQNKLVSPLLHNQIVTGYSLTEDYLIITCRRCIAGVKKEIEYKWSLTILIERILNFDEIMMFLKENKYENVILDKNKEPVKSKKIEPKKEENQPKLNL